MGRKSSLTDEQWIEVERRHIVDGESINSLSKAYGINESSIRRKIKPNNAEGKSSDNPLKTLAFQKIAIDQQQKEIAEQIAELPVAKQMIVNDLARKLTNISGHLASAAEYGAINANRLSELANSQLGTVNEETLMTGEGMVALKLVGALQDLANEASKVPLGLLNANKDQVVKLNNPQHSDLQGMTDEELFAIASRGS